MTTTNKQGASPSVELVAFDYDRQEWVEGEPARLLLIEQLTEERALLTGPRASEFVGRKTTVAKALAECEARLTKLKDMGQPEPMPTWEILVGESGIAVVAEGWQSNPEAYICSVQANKRTATNAHKIAAVPELIAALQQAQAWLGNMPSGHASNAVLPVIDAALKKAGVL